MHRHVLASTYFALGETSAIPPGMRCVSSSPIRPFFPAAAGAFRSCAGRVNLESAFVRITRLDASDERILRDGSVAVVSVRMEMSGTFHGAPFAGPFRYTRVWCERPDGWRIVAGHVGAVLA